MTMSERMKGTPLDRRIHALREDLLDGDGPQISTMRNYRFAILPYNPEREWDLRQKVSTLAGELKAGGWVVHTMSLRKLMLRHLRRKTDDQLDRLVEREKSLYERDPERSRHFITNRLSKLLKGSDGLATEIVDELDRLTDEQPDRAERTVAFLGQVGALYPFLRTSALLRHLDGKTHRIPIVLLYPGEETADGGLSFMSQLDPNQDYRPRIY